MKMRRSWLVLVSLFLCLLFLAIAVRLNGRIQRERAVLPIAAAAAEEFDVPLAMILAVISVESDFYPNAVSSAGARGLMQLMPETFTFLRDERLKEKHTDEEIDDPCVNIRYGTCYLAYLKARFNTWPETLAAYNAGEGRVEEWLADPELAENGQLIRIPFPETAAYTKNVQESFTNYQKRFSVQGER